MAARRKLLEDEVRVARRAPSLAAIDARVADVLALDDVDDVLRDVGGVIAVAFEIFGHQD